MSWNLTVNRLFSQDKSFFVSDKKWVLWVNLGKYPPHLATSTVMLGDWTHLYFVLSMRGHPHELKPCHSQSRLVIFLWEEKVSVLGEFMKTFPTFGNVYTDVGWLNTSVQKFVVSIKGHPNELKPYHEVRLFSQDKSFFVTEISDCSGWICEIFPHIIDVYTDVGWLNNLFCQLIRMSSYAKNKLQMCSVSQHQCTDVAKCGWKFHNFTQYTHFFSVTKKMTCLDWTIYSW